MITIKIGKAEDNDYIINDPHVSRHHALLKVNEDGSYIIEDLASGNGTFVNGQQILCKKITLSDRIILGNKCEINISDILNKINDYSIEFDLLKKIYKKYQSEKVKIQSSNQFKTRILQSLPFAFPGIVGISLGISGFANLNVLFVSLFVAIIAPVCGIVMGAKQAAKTPEQLQILSDKFKIDYVCPKCGVFLGEIPWQSLKNRGKCTNPSCNVKW
jgi:hypothetical protein